MKIVITDCRTVTNGDLDIKIFEDFGEVSYYENTECAYLSERIKDADAVLCNKSQMTAEVMKNAKNLKYIGLFATGYNNIDTEYTQKHGITVCNAGSYSTDAVAQHVFSLILNHFNNTSRYDAFVKEKGWMNSKTFSPFVFPINELCGKTLGIVGYGSIGRQVAKIAKAFSMNVIVYTRTIKEDKDTEFVTLCDLAQRSDIITLHCPLNSSSQNMIDINFLKKCKKSAYLINTARGAVVNEKDLRKALDEEIIAGAAVDVLNSEPMSTDCVLFGAKNITFTPHVAWAPIETRERLFRIVYDNLKAFTDGKPVNIVK